MSQRNPLDVERDGAIVRLRFARPEVLNALDRASAEAFRDAAFAIAGDPTVRCVVIAGAGRAFMAGGDVASFGIGSGREAEAAAAIITPLHEGLLTLRAQNAPIVAVLQGAVAGAGMSVALAADLAIAADNVRFVYAYSALGVSPDGSSTFFLPRLIGLRRAMEIALLNRPIPAAEALSLGLVGEVVPLDGLEAAAAALAGRLAAGPTVAFGATRRLFERSFGATLADQLEAERQSFMACARTADFVEGASAFLQKRGADFHGR